MRGKFAGLVLSLACLGLCLPALAQSGGKPEAKPAAKPQTGEPKTGEHKAGGDTKGEKVENPEYKHWSQFKPGAYSKIKMTSEFGGTKTESMMTTKLKTVTPDKCEIEITTVTMINGKEHAMPPQTRDIHAKIAKADADSYNNPEGKVKDGKEEITVAGKAWKTQWFEVVTKVGETTANSKTWICEDVPGRVVKLTTESKGQVAMTTAGELIEFKADKK